MHAALLLLLVLAPAQDTNFVPRTQKEIYLNAVKELNRAADLISDDAGVAIEKITSLLANSKIKHNECRLRIELASQEFQLENYFPYQVRGRARMAQGKKIVDRSPQGAVELFKAAFEDFKTSAAKKVPGNEELMKQAEAARKEAEGRIPGDDPVEEFRRKKYNQLIRENKFPAAVSAVTGEDGKALNDEQKQALIAAAEGDCRSFVAERLFKIRQNLGDITSVRALKELQDSGFRQQFANPVPTDEQVTEKAAKEPSLVWIRKHLKTLKAIQAGQAKLDDVFAAAQEGLATDPPDAEGDNPWFRAMALLGGNLVEDTIANCTRDSENLLKAERAKRQADAEKAHATWKEFVGKTDKKVQERHPELADRSDRLERSVKAFPVELTQLSAFNIDDCFVKDPTTDFKRVEDGLFDLLRELASLGKVSIESRQELYTKYIIAGTLRRIIDGVDENDIIREFGQHKDGLRKAGGPGNVEKYGPKVKKVFDGLKT